MVVVGSKASVANVSQQQVAFMLDWVHW